MRGGVMWSSVNCHFFVVVVAIETELKREESKKRALIPRVRSSVAASVSLRAHNAILQRREIAAGGRESEAAHSRGASVPAAIRAPRQP